MFKRARTRQSSLLCAAGCGFGRGRDSEGGSSFGEPVSFGRSERGPDVSSAACDSLTIRNSTDAPRRADPRSAELGGNRRLSAGRGDREPSGRGLVVKTFTGGPLLVVGCF
jgi:hypothetical protein